MKVLIKSNMRGEVLVSGVFGLRYEDEKEFLQKFQSFKDKYLKPQYNALLN